MDRTPKTVESLNSIDTVVEKSKKPSRFRGVVAGFVLASAAVSTTACQEPDAQAEPGQTSSPSISETVAPTETSTSPDVTETPSETTPDVETMPNGEALLTPYEIDQMRQNDGEEAVKEYFTPTIDKLGMTREEISADPTEFGNRFGELYTAYEEALLNTPAGINDQVTPNKQTDFMDYVGHLADVTAVFRGSDDIEEALRYAAEIQFISTVGGTNQLISWNLDEKVNTTEASTGTYKVDISTHVTNDSILYDHVPADYYKMYDQQANASLKLTIATDGTIVVGR